MFKSKKLKGFSLIEVICGLCIFTVTFMYLMSVEVRNVKLHKYNNDISRSIEFIEALKSNIVYKYGYQEIKELFNSHSNGYGEKLYINTDSINIEILKSEKLGDIVSKESNGSRFVELFVDNIDENVIEITLKLNTNSSIGSKSIETKIYKGDY